MSYYIDTSVWVAALTNEQATSAVQAWLAECEPGQLQLSDWVVTEFSSAIAIKLRTGQLGPEQRASVRTAFFSLVESSARIVPTTRDDFRAAEHYCSLPETGLRAGDALHLAVCANHGLTMVTLDKTLQRAGIVLGVATLAPLA